MVDAYLHRCAEDTVSLAWLVLTRMEKNKWQGFLKLREFIVEYQLEQYSEGNVKVLLTSLRKGNIQYSAWALLNRFLGC